MRLQVQLQLVDAALTKIPKVGLSQQPTSFWTAPGKEAYVQGLQLLQDIPYLATEVKNLLARHEMQVPGDTFVVAEGGNGTFTAILESFRARLELSSQILKVAVSAPASDTMLAVRIPPGGLIDDAEKALSQVKNALAAIVLQPEVEGRKLELIGFDTGSAYLILDLGTKVAMGLVGAVLAVAYTVNQIRTQNSQARGYIASADASGAAVKAAEQATETLIDILVAEHVKQLNEKYYAARPEHLAELRNSIQMLSALLDKGAKIEPAKLLPLKADNPFPDVDKLVEATTPKQLQPPTEKERK